MGADATLYVFDYREYSEVVAPVFEQLICRGIVEASIGELVRALADKYRINIPSTPVVPAGFRQHCTTLDDDFGMRRPAGTPGQEYQGDWNARACREKSCALLTDCPFHISRGDQLDCTMDNCFWVLEQVTAERCLGLGQFLGRSIDCYFYWETLDALGIDPVHPTRHLLERLGRRGRVVGYRGSAGTEGIHGWLTPEEAKMLGNELFTLRLPDYEVSFTAMQSFERMGNILEGRGLNIEFLAATYDHPTASFAELSLSFVRTVCLIAAREGKGVLWGNDVSPGTRDL